MPACMWNDVKESCSPSQLVFLSLNSAPSTVVHRCAGWAVLGMRERDHSVCAIVPAWGEGEGLRGGTTARQGP